MPRVTDRLIDRFGAAAIQLPLTLVVIPFAIVTPEGMNVSITRVTRCFRPAMPGTTSLRRCKTVRSSPSAASGKGCVEPSVEPLAQS